MATGAVYTKNGFNGIIHRAYTAAPTQTVPSRFGIGTGTTTPTTSDTALATKISTWSGGSDYKNFVGGYPTFNTTDQKVTVQAFIASTEANSNTITEIGDFNTDGSPVMSSRIVFTGIAKTSTIQMFITTVYKRT